MKLSGFDWDDGNREKCQKHGLTIEDIESVFDGSFHTAPDIAHSGMEARLLAIGKAASGRHVLIAFTLRDTDGETLIRPISARYMHRKEIHHYEQATSRP